MYAIRSYYDLLPGISQVRLRYTPYFEEKEQRTRLEPRMQYDEMMNPVLSMFNGESEVIDYEQDDDGPYVLRNNFV